MWDEAGQQINGTFLSLADTTQQIIRLSTELPQSAASLAEGLYNVASSGFQGTDAMKVLDASARAASAGLTTTDSSARAITAVLNAYGKTATDATDVSDTMFQVVNRGVITFDELAQNMGDIAPIAASAGISFDEAGAALATMTLSGLPASEAATSLQGAIRGLLDPSKEMAALLESLGYESGTAALKALGLKGVLDVLRQATGNQADEWLKLFEDSRAARGAMAATANDGRLLADVSADVTDKTARQGATQAALAKQSESLAYQLQIVKNTIAAMAAQFGEALLPAAKAVATVIQTITGAVALMPASFFKAAAVVANLAAGLTALGAFLLSKWIAAKVFAVAIDLMTTAMEAAGVSTRLFTGTLNALAIAQTTIIGTITGITVAMVLLGQATANAKARASELSSELTKGIDAKGYDAVTQKVKAYQDALDAANKSNEKYQGALGGVRAFFGNIVQTLTPLGNEIADLDAEQTQYTSDLEAAQGALAKYNDNVQSFAATSGMTRDAVIKLAEANNIDLTGSFTTVQAALGKVAGGMNAVEIATNSFREHVQNVADQITKTFTPMAAYQAAQQAASKSVEQSSAAAKRTISDRFAKEKETLSAAERAEKDTLERQTKNRQDALAAQHDDVVDAIEKRHRAEQDAYDDEARAQKQTLDRQQRAEREALDDRLKLLDEEADKRKKAEERRWEDEKDQIQFMIDSTFGAEREGWKERLTAAEDAHDDKLNVIDDETDKAKRTEKDNLDDRQTQEKNSLDDRLRTLKENLALREQAEKDAEDLRYNNAKTALDNETTQLQNNLDDKYKRLGTNLENRQRKEEDAADARYTSNETKNKIALAQYQTFLDAQLKAADKFNTDLAIIASRGGADVMEEIAKLPPEIVAQVAAAGPEAFTRFLESIRQSLASGQRAPTLPGDLGGGYRHKGGQQAADGMILRFADGGHYAQIAAAGSMRLWAEPETGGEAYIPLARSKRDRSAGILGQVAELFGYGLVQMANGGIVAGGGVGRGGVEINMPISIEARVAAGVDPDAVGRAIAVHARRAVDEALDTLERTVVMKAWRTR